jgi:metal-responsive CopG/Arc/MetJ family transcriptional regulator
MAKREKIAITVDDTLLARVERLRKKSGESRSAVFERALTAYLSGPQRAAESQKYIEAYRRQPDSAAEVRDAQALAVNTLGAEEWDEAR